MNLLLSNEFEIKHQNINDDKVQNVLMIDTNRIVLFFEHRYIIYDIWKKQIIKELDLHHEFSNIKFWHNDIILAIMTKKNTHQQDQYCIVAFDLMINQIKFHTTISPLNQNNIVGEIVPKIYRFQGLQFAISQKTSLKQSITFFDQNMKIIEKGSVIFDVIEIYSQTQQSLVTFEQHIMEQGRVNIFNADTTKNKNLVFKMEDTECLLHFVSKLTQTQLLAGFNNLGSGCFFQIRSSQFGVKLSKVYSNQYNILRHIYTDIQRSFVFYTSLETYKLNNKYYKRLYVINFKNNQKSNIYTSNIRDDEITDLYGNKTFLSYMLEQQSSILTKVTIHKLILKSSLYINLMMRSDIYNLYGDDMIENVSKLFKYN